jgi:carbonic anhydrase
MCLLIPRLSAHVRPSIIINNGSLTTPPCSEGVAWFIMKTPIKVSAEQVSQFTAVMHQNARPVQPLHDRVVLEKP